MSLWAVKKSPGAGLGEKNRKNITILHIQRGKLSGLAVRREIQEGRGQTEGGAPGAPIRERAWECRSQKSQAWSGRAHPESCTSQRKATELRAFMSTKDGKQLRRAVSREVQSSAKGQTQCAEITQRLGGKDSNDSWFTW